LRPIRVEFDNSQETLDNGLVLSFHEERGSRERGSIVFLHGRNAHSGTWRQNVSYFSQKLGYRVLAPTLPRVDGSPARNDIAEYSRYIAELLGKLGIERASFVGNSMGGWVAMQLAVNYPKLVESLVLEDSAGVDSGLPERIEQIPVLIIWGENDEILSVKNARILNSLISRSLLVTIKNVGHVFHWEKPEEFNKTVERFLS
jgi:2-hydroxy-6-oxonona-2,4-dienedioate hydrolase